MGGQMLDAETQRDAGNQRLEWVELRDERGKLCARLAPGQGLLEVRRNDRTTVFDLAAYLRPVQISEF